MQTRLCAILAERLSNERPGTDGTVDMLCTLAILCATSRGLAALVRSSQFALAATHLALNMRGQHQASKLAVLSFIENAARSSANLIIENSEHASAAAATLQQTLTPLVADVLKLTRTQIMEERVGALCACCSLAMLRWGMCLCLRANVPAFASLFVRNARWMSSAHSFFWWRITPCQVCKRSLLRQTSCPSLSTDRRRHRSARWRPSMRVFGTRLLTRT